MYVNPKTGLTEYETFDELLNAEIILMSEDDVNYYIRTKPQQLYENCVWVVNKITENVSFIYFTDYIVDYMDKVTPIDWAKFKRAG